eukprot:6446515-Amphidinium_carterae.1
MPPTHASQHSLYFAEGEEVLIIVQELSIQAVLLVGRRPQRMSDARVLELLEQLQQPKVSSDTPRNMSKSSCCAMEVKWSLVVVGVAILLRLKLILFALALPVLAYYYAPAAEGSEVIACA